MRKITDIYDQYKIMPNLQIHQLRVAAVAWQICDSLDLEVDKENIIKACLLHDMGNIIKFHLEYFPQFLEPQGLAYWQDIQNEYFEKYGKDEHSATIEIVKELAQEEIIVEFIDSIGFTRSISNLKDNILSHEICSYADQRVGPHGIVSLQDRFIDGNKRYKNHPQAFNLEQRIELEKSLLKIEENIFSLSKIKPEDISDESIKKYIEDLKNFEI